MTNPIQNNQPTTQTPPAQAIKTATGDKSIVENVVSIALNIAVDIWYFVSFGVDVIFVLFMCFTLFLAVKFAIELGFKIEVSESGVTGRGRKGEFTLTYSEIANVEVKGKNLHIITTAGQKHSLKISNAGDISTVIMFNKSL